MDPTKILLFEDNPGDARLIQEFLREYEPTKISIDQVKSLLAGLEYLAQGKPDVILLDLGLPDSQGLDTFTKINEQFPDVPTVILTGLNDTELSVRAVKAGAQDYLLKSDINSGGFLRAIRYAIERKQADKALIESETRFRALFEEAPIGYQSLDIDGNFIEVNQMWLNILGYSREEVIGHWFGDFLAPEYKEVFQKRFPIFITLGQIHSEFEMIRKDGSRRFIDFEGRIGKDSKGQFKQTHCTLEDISERMAAEKKINEQLNELTRWQSVMLDREDRVQELKREVNELLINNNQPPRYSSIKSKKKIE